MRDIAGGSFGLLAYGLTVALLVIAFTVISLIASALLLAIGASWAMGEISGLGQAIAWIASAMLIFLWAPILSLNSVFGKEALLLIGPFVPFLNSGLWMLALLFTKQAREFVRQRCVASR